MLANAIPSLTCLVAIIWMPRISRASHALWRALQVYDHQAPSAPKDDTRAIREAVMCFVLNLIGVVYSMLSGFYKLTGDKGEWLARRPVLVSIRNTVPWVFTYGMAYQLVGAVHMYLLKRQVYVKRLPHAAKKELATLQLHTPDPFHAQASKTQKRLITAARMVFAAALTYSLHYYCYGSTLSSDSGGTPVIVLAVLGGLLMYVGLAFYPPVLNRHASFRGLCTLPFAVLVFVALFLFAFFLLVVGVMALIDVIFKTALVLTSNKGSGSDAEKEAAKAIAEKFVDVAHLQLSAIYSSYISSWVCILPAILVAMAYRFDAAQAGHSNLSTSEKEEILFAAGTREPTSDTYGCSPVLVRKAAIRIPNKDLPIYHSAIFTLIATQFFGFALEQYLEWPFASIFPVNKAQVALMKWDISPWPLVAYPLMLAAMLIRARCRSKQTFIDLWKYNEKWTREEGDAKAATSIVTSTADMDEDEDEDRDMEAAEEKDHFIANLARV